MFRSGYLLLFALAPALLLLSRPVMADQFDIPTYHYFYACDSGVVDCANFDRNNGLNGYHGWDPANCFFEPSTPACSVVPTNWDGPLCSSPLTEGSGPCWASFGVEMSNKRGDVLGNGLIDYWGEPGVPVLTYGSHGQLTIIGTEYESLGVAINNNGLYLFENRGQPYIGYGPNDFERLNNRLDLRNLEFPTYVGRLYGINDDNDILVTLVEEGEPNFFSYGVLSPGPIPEPSAVILLATAICGCILAFRKRRTPVG